MTRVGILDYSLVSSGGYSVDETFHSLITRADTRTKMPARIAEHVRPQYGHFIDTEPIYVPDRLFAIASQAADQIIHRAVRPIDAVVIGSTSDSFARRELGESSSPNLSFDLKSRYSIPKHLQFSNACASASTAIILGRELIRQGKAEVVLAGGADEICASVVSAFDSVRIYGDRCRPFDKDRRGLVLGEAAAFVLLSRTGDHLAYLDGAGMTSDAKDVAAMDYPAISKAILQAMAEARTENVDLICAHGTGTKENDQAEIQAIDMVWQEQSVPYIVSYKGGLGHPQGASGAVGLALVLESMKRNLIFPTVGCDVPDPDLGRDLINVNAITSDVNSALVLSHGTWGVNTAMVVTAA